MPIVYADRVKETTTTTGTGPVTLGGASTGFQTFLAGVGLGNQSYYAIVDNTLGDWEVGLGTLGVGTLSRDLVLSSSNLNALVPFLAGSKDVFTVSPATFFSGAMLTTAHATTAHAGISGVGNLATAPGAGLVDHTTLNHSAIPGVPAPEAFTAGVHGTTDHTGITGVDPLPTVTNWGANTQTLGANKTLTDADPTIQYLNSNGGNYYVALPAVSTANKQLLIFNTSTSGGSLLVRLGTVVLGIILPGYFSRVYSDGLKWCVTDPALATPSTARSMTVLHYNGVTAIGLRANVRAQPAATDGPTSQQIRHKMPIAGTITGGFVTPADGTGSFGVQVNAVTQATVPYGSIFGVNPFVISVPFAAGDYISIIGISNSVPPAAFGLNFCLFVQYTAQPGDTVYWSHQNAAAPYAVMNGILNVDSDYASPDIGNQLILPTAVRVINASWDVLINAQPFSLLKNTALAATINPGSTAAGVQALDVLYQAGDVLSVTTPTGLHAHLGFQFEWGGSIVCFAGKRSAGSEYLCAFTSIERTGPTAALASAIWRAPYTGRIRYSVASGDNASNVLTIYINGIARKTINVGALVGLVDSYDGFTFAAGDLITVKAGAAGNRANIQLWTLSE